MAIIDLQFPSFKLLISNPLYVPAETTTNAPRFVRAFGDRNTFEGDIVRFDCHIQGDPKPEVAWFKDGVKVNQGVFQISEEGEKHSLIIGEVFDEDAGVYQCQAKNKRGQTTCSAVLKIGGKTQISAAYFMRWVNGSGSMTNKQGVIASSNFT